ncbi:putative lipid II flippase FtsW [Candidatus Parcubacteria bacterium]|nr:putative lipid II flippase FtsW [Candidatus Parcubacteria bacterium]
MEKQRGVDTPFLLIVCALIICGLLVFTSAGLGLLARDGVTFTSVAISQLLLGLVCGSIAMYVLSRIDYKWWRPYTPYFFAFAMLLTLATLIPGIGLELKGASRWIVIGGFSFQPIELLKLATIAFLAAIYAAKVKTVGTWQGGILPLVLIAGSASLILILQPDTDGVAMIVLSAVAMLFAAGGRVSHMLILALVGVLVLGALVYERPYLASRFDTFINQSHDPKGAGWQVQQSLIAVGSGGLIGRGFGQSLEKYSYLPEPIGDSIFAVAAEEFGFIGSVALVLLFATFGILGFRIAARAPDPFGALLAVGLVVLIVGQSFLNMASAVALVPVSGLPLIFVSHGGTAFAIALAEVGVLLNISRRMKS